MNKKHLHLIVILVAILASAVLIFSLSGAGNPGGASMVSYDGKPVSPQFLNGLAIPANVSNAVGIWPEGYKGISKIKNTTPLYLNGKPEVLYIGAEYCPYCAAERWAMIIALMRFGTFSGISYMTSSSSDYAPNSPTFTFVNSTYYSPYISFVSVEIEGNKAINGSFPPSYPTLQRPTHQENTTFFAYNPGGSIPFVDFGNSSVLVGATYDPLSVLNGDNWSIIEGKLHDPSTMQSQAIVGSANLLTAQICAMDNNTPASVCGQGYVKQAESAG